VVDAPGPPLVFDSSALIAYLKREPGGAAAGRLLHETATPRLIHALNLCEVYYHFLRFAAEPQLAEMLNLFAQAGLTTRDDLDPPFWQEVARLKARFQHPSLADCFVVALARRVGGAIVTSDHPGFDPILAQGVCQVSFIR